MGTSVGEKGIATGAGHAQGPGTTPEGIGARLPRKEDARYVRGQGEYVGDIHLPRMQEVTFLRSPVAHARIRSIRIAPAFRDRVFTADDLDGVRAIRADTALSGFKSSLQPVLAVDRVRHVRSEEHTSELQSQFHLVCRL